MNESYKDNFWEELKSGRFASMVKESAKGRSVANSSEVYNILKPLFAERDDIEKAYFIFMDSKNAIIGIENLFSGTISSSAIYPREIVKRAIAIKANAFVMGHNHPSGDTKPSPEDEYITRKVYLAAASIDIYFHDHIIVGDGYHSMADSGSLKKISREFKDILKQGIHAMNLRREYQRRSISRSWKMSLPLPIGHSTLWPGIYIGSWISSRQHSSEISQFQFLHSHLKRQG